MMVSHIHIANYDWVVHCYFDVSPKDTYVIGRAVERIGANDRTMKRVWRILTQGRLNSGFTYSNKRTHESVMMVSRTTCSAEILNTISHEIRHLCDDIADECGIAPQGEEVAYLTGSVTMKAARQIQALTCQCEACKGLYQ